MNNKSKEIIEDIVCPFCGGSDFVLGKQDGYASIRTEKLSFRDQTLYHDICKDCGSIVRSYIKNPDKFSKR